MAPKPPSSDDQNPAPADDPPWAPSANDDWPTFAPRHLPAGGSYKSVTPVPMPAPIDADAAAPNGAHPSYTHGYYDRDNAFYTAWDEIAADRDRFLAWMDEHVLAGEA